jgi:4-amino-4-deoxy-L-arabinose transferase-like glycosyltransferase
VPAPPRHRWPALLTVLIVAAPLVALAEFRAAARLDDVDDQRMFAYFGWRIAHGAVVYRDVWDNKPPGVYWVSALGYRLAGDHTAGVVALCTFASFAALAGCYVAARGAFGRPTAIAATLIAACFLTHPYYEGGTHRTESYLVVCELWAVALYVLGVQRRHWAWFVAAGACGGLAFVFKQVGLAAWGALGVHTLALALLRHVSWRAAIGRGLALLTGGGAVIGLTAAALAAQGTFDAAWGAIFTFNRAYFVVGSSNLFSSYENLQRVLSMYHELRLPIVLAALAVPLALLGAVQRRVGAELIPLPAPRCPAFAVLACVWLSVAFYGAAVSPHHFQHYVLPTIPPLVLLGAATLHALLTTDMAAVRLRRYALICAAVMAIGFEALPAVQRNWGTARAVRHDRRPTWTAGRWRPQVQPSLSEQVGAAIAAITQPTDTIQGWGFWPNVYLAARRPSASRFATTEKLGQVGAQANWIYVELVATLQAHPPAVFFLHDRDRRILLPDDRPPPDAIGDLLKAQYVHVGRIGDMHLYRRRDLPPCSLPATAGE